MYYHIIELAACHCTNIEDQQYVCVNTRFVLNIHDIRMLQTRIYSRLGSYLSVIAAECRFGTFIISCSLYTQYDIKSEHDIQLLLT